MRTLASNWTSRLVVPSAALLAAVSLSGCLGWFPQLLGSGGSVLEGVSCPSAGFCVAVGQTGSDGGNGLIEVTTDDGTHWTSQTVDPLLDSVSCASDHCVAVGTGILFTNDGGTSWTPAANTPAGVGGLTSVSCPSAQQCWAVGGETVLMSSDGGTDWSSQPWAPPSAIGGFAGGPYALVGTNLTSIACPSVSVCVSVGAATYTWENPPPETTLPPETQFVTLDMTTADGGQTWSAGVGQNYPFAPGGLNAVSCPSVQECVALGEGQNGSGALQLTSTDGGSTWTAAWMSEQQPLSAKGVFCTSASQCLAVGSNPGGQYGSPVMTSADGGNTWQPQATQDSSAALHAVTCESGSLCWAVGSTGVGAIVLHTLTAGHAWPEVSSISPASGPVTGGTSVVVNGLQFALGVTSVSFGSTTTTSFVIDSPTQITVASPPMAGGSSQTVDVIVNSGLGSSPPTPADQFTYLANG